MFVVVVTYTYINSWLSQYKLIWSRTLLSF